MMILLLSSILLITLDLRGNAVFNAARSGFGYAMRPFEIAGEVVTRPVTRVWDGMTKVDDLERENARLQQQIDTQRSDQVAAQAAIQENNAAVSREDTVMNIDASQETHTGLSTASGTKKSGKAPKPPARPTGE